MERVFVIIAVCSQPFRAANDFNVMRSLASSLIPEISGDFSGYHFDKYWNVENQPVDVITKFAGQLKQTTLFSLTNSKIVMGTLG